jgi:hypothetical protein
MAERRTWVTPTLANEIVGGEWTTEQDIAALPDNQQAGCRSNLVSVNSNPQARDAADRLLFSLIKEMHELGVPMLADQICPTDAWPQGGACMLSCGYWFAPASRLGRPSEPPQ